MIGASSMFFISSKFNTAVRKLDSLSYTAINAKDTVRMQEKRTALGLYVN